ncbi:MAG: peptidase M22 [Clostridia bacterium]|nr:peptidase M22 [Clostridia bacterium]
MPTECFLGIDTSNYTTSVGLVSREGEILANIKRPLPVAAGERGLRQSDALFAHTKNLPSAMEELGDLLIGKQVVAVGVSRRPRNVEGSYMPCFLAGVAAAHTAAAVHGVPLYTFSHQCGHLMAALCSSGRLELLSRPFGAFHVSGGTTELVRAEKTDGGFAVTCVGGAKDLHAGQAIDRIGVALGLPFPCGPALEQLALQNNKKIPRKKVAADGCYVNLSGLENMALKLYKESEDASLVAAFVLDFLGNAIAGMAKSYVETYGNETLLFAGGVMCNSIIRKRLEEQFDAAFATPALSADNAVGTALLTAAAHHNI